MRKDQVNLSKEFERMEQYITLLETSIDEQEIEIDYLREENASLYQDLLISRIEYDRLLMSKPALTSRYALVRGLAEGINEM